ncbi:MAG TPA: hypothetical protein VFA75_06910 [Nevskia sp.]|nr:hypothetical protein [Nevskia sp.]
MKRPAVLLIAIGIVILVGLALLLRPGTPPAATPTSPARAITADAAPAQPPVRSFDIVVGHGRRVSGPELIQVHAGDNVVLRVTSDQADELHLHGYDLHLHLRPGEPGALAFQALHSGRFDYELHHAQLELGALEVLPQ